jgi:hypothetical protein
MTATGGIEATAGLEVTAGSGGMAVMETAAEAAAAEKARSASIWDCTFTSLDAR